MHTTPTSIPAATPAATPAPASNLTIAFIGGGNMATALICGLAGKLTAAANLHVVEIYPPAREKLHLLGVQTSASIHADVAQCDVVVLAVKPQQMREVAAQLQPFLTSQLLLSIAAGIRAADLSRWMGGYGAIVRTMPNTPALVGRGITGMAALAGVTSQQRETADAIMCAVGTTVWVDDESLIDPVTAISGSGPAYVFYFIEALEQAGMRLGLSAEQANALAIATFTGASQLAAEAHEPVAVLRERVTSKGGTTHAALTSLQESGVADAILRAVEAACNRSIALGEESAKL